MATPEGNTAHITTVIEWPENRPTDVLITERMLAAALHNHHVALTRARNGRTFEMVTWPQMTDAQRAFYIDWAIPQALQVIWRGR